MDLLIWGCLISAADSSGLPTTLLRSEVIRAKSPSGVNQPVQYQSLTKCFSTMATTPITVNHFSEVVS